MKTGRPPVDMTGLRFGLLTVVSRADVPKRGQDTSARWNCLCDCGKNFLATRRRLQQGGTRSCGAKEHRREKKGPQKLANRRRLYIAGANQRGLAWTLTDEQFVELVCQPCFYCGRGGEEKATSIDDWVEANGVDRFNNDVGYTPENSVPCCTTCNTAKNTMTADQFIARCTAVAYRFFKHAQQTQ